MLRSQLKSYNGGDPLWGFVAIVGTERFTGEAVVGPEPRVHLYAADGRIYYAERSGDAPIGQRLVDAGVLTATELEYGSVDLAGVRSLARLFQRVPSIDRDAVELTVELATEGLLEAVADLPVGMPELRPLRHHPAGIHHWLRSANTVRPPAALPEAGADAAVEAPQPQSAGAAPTAPDVGEAPWSSPDFGEPRFAEPEAEASAGVEADAAAEAEPEAAAEAGGFDAAPADHAAADHAADHAAADSHTHGEPEHHLEQLPAIGADAEWEGRDRLPEPETTQLAVVSPDLPESPEPSEGAELIGSDVSQVDVAADVAADAYPAQPTMAPLSLAALPALAPEAAPEVAPTEINPAHEVAVDAGFDAAVMATDSADTGYTPAEPPTPISEPPLVARLAPLPLDSAAALAAIPEADDLPPLSELAYLPSGEVPAASVFTSPVSSPPTLADRPVYEPLASSPTEADLFSPVGGPEQPGLPKLATAPIGVEELMAANADDALRATNAAQPHNLAAVEIWELVDHIMDEPQSNGPSNEPTPAGESRERGRRRSKKG